MPAASRLVNGYGLEVIKQWRAWRESTPKPLLRMQATPLLLRRLVLLKLADFLQSSSMPAIVGKSTLLIVRLCTRIRKSMQLARVSESKDFER
jgi:hypothetical protein